MNRKVRMIVTNSVGEFVRLASVGETCQLESGQRYTFAYGYVVNGVWYRNRELAKAA